MDVRVERVGSAEEPILRNLFEFWHYDFSERLGGDVGADGRFGSRGFDRVLERPDVEAFLFRIDGSLVGFALVHPDGDGGTFVDRFFILRKYRRLGVGTAAARRLFEVRPGAWGLTVRTQNPEARDFWRAALRAVAADVREEERDFPDGIVRIRFDFRAPTSG